jgi:putative ABC transport system permease protein
MFKTNLKIAWRHIIKDRLYSTINIVGLSAGIGFTLLIAAYVWTELRVNGSLENASSQYIIQSKWKEADQGIEITSIGLLAKTIKEDYPSLVKNYFRWDGVTSTISKGDKSFREGIQICDSTMLQMYGFRLLYGDPKTAFNKPFSLVLTKERAIKYFGKADVVGQTLSVESFSGTKHDFVVAGVMENPAKNSVTVLTPENDNQFYVPAVNINYFGRNMDVWNNPYIVSYIELQKGVDPKKVEQALKDILRKHADPKTAANLTPYIVPLKKFYLSANNGLIQKLLYSLSAIALFILFMAMINFINLSVSRASRRLKEIGMRKVLGGMRYQLIMQFLVESSLLVLGATILGLWIYAAGRDAVGHILNENLPPIGSLIIGCWPYLILMILVVGIAAGIYPAFVLSAMKSVNSLKGKLVAVGEKLWLRKSLVGFQFMSAIVVLVGSIVVSQQVQLFFSGNLGYKKDQVVSFQVPRNWTSSGVRQMELVRDQLSMLPQVEQISLSYEVPTGNNSGVFALYKQGTDPMSAVQTQNIITDEYYADTYKIPLVAGAFYGPPGNVADSSRVVINEKMSKALGFRNPDEAIGHQVLNQGDDRTFTIAGVIRDFHFASMHTNIAPMTLFQLKAIPVFRVFSVRLAPGDVSASVQAIGKKWSALLPGAPFQYTFMDDSLKELYRAEIQLKQSSYIATVLAFIIILLGILGLVSQNIQKRTKEIGIRKLLGSSIRNILGLFMKEIFSTLMIAGLIACPLVYLLMQRWLEGYAYRIELTPFPFVVALMVLSVLTAVLITLQTIKTAMANPVKNLRSE